VRPALGPATAVLHVLGFAAVSEAQTVPRGEDMQRIERHVATLAQEAATLCPLSDPGDQTRAGSLPLDAVQGFVLEAQSRPHRVCGAGRVRRPARD